MSVDGGPESSKKPLMNVLQNPGGPDAGHQTLKCSICRSRFWGTPQGGGLPVAVWFGKLGARGLQCFINGSSPNVTESVVSGGGGLAALAGGSYRQLPGRFG